MKCQVGSKIKKGVPNNIFFSFLVPSLCKQFYYLRLGLRNPQLPLKFKSDNKCGRRQRLDRRTQIDKLLYRFGFNSKRFCSPLPCSQPKSFYCVPYKKNRQCCQTSLYLYLKLQNNWHTKIVFHKYYWQIAANIIVLILPQLTLDNAGAVW